MKVTVLDVAVDLIISALIAFAFFHFAVGPQAVAPKLVASAAGIYGGAHWVLDLVRGRGWRYATACSAASAVGLLTGGLVYIAFHS